jgi:hypothetical protein
MCDADKVSTDKTNIILASDIPETSSSNFMLSVWFYIDNWGNNIANEKNILYMAKDQSAKTVQTLQTQLSGISNKVTIQDTVTAPVVGETAAAKVARENAARIAAVGLYKNINIALDKYENNLFIDLESYLDKKQTSGTNFTRYKIPNIPVQKWNNLTISIDTRTLDVYLDGKLRNSFIMHGFYKNYYDNSTKKNIYIGNMGTNNIGFAGFITRIRYVGYSINPQEAYNIYKEGISSSLATTIFNKYSLKVSFLEYNKEKGSFQL